jgi:isocitrate dehydrogenase
MIPYLKYPKNSTKKFLGITNSFGQVAGYKISMQKSVALLYMNNEETEREIKETIPFTITSNNNKIIPQMKLTEEITDIFNENYKQLKEKLKKTLEDGKISYAHVLAKSTLSK